MVRMRSGVRFPTEAPKLKAAGLWPAAFALESASRVLDDRFGYFGQQTALRGPPSRLPRTSWAARPTEPNGLRGRTPPAAGPSSRPRLAGPSDPPFNHLVDNGLVSSYG